MNIRRPSFGCLYSEQGKHCWCNIVIVKTLNLPSSFFFSGQKFTFFVDKEWSPMNRNKLIDQTFSQKKLIKRNFLGTIEWLLTGSLFYCVYFHRCKRRIFHWRVERRLQQKWIETADTRSKYWQHFSKNQQHNQKLLLTLGYVWWFLMVATHVTHVKFSL